MFPPADITRHSLVSRHADSSPGVLYAACGCLALVADTTLGAVLCVVYIASADVSQGFGGYLAGPWAALSLKLSSLHTARLLRLCIVYRFVWLRCLYWLNRLSCLGWRSIDLVMLLPCGGLRAEICAEGCFWCLLGRFLSVSDRNLSPHQFIWLYHSMTAIAISATDICIR